MGRDKAMVEVDGVPMAARVASALHAGGCAPVLAVGGDGTALRGAGLDWVPDDYPGEGPLGGVLTALGAVDTEVVVVLACDLPAVAVTTVRALAAAMASEPAADAWMADTGRLEPLCAAWRRTAAAHLSARFAAGVRAVHLAIHGLRVLPVPVEPAALRNVNTPDDLRGITRVLG